MATFDNMAAPNHCSDFGMPECYRFRLTGTEIFDMELARYGFSGYTVMMMVKMSVVVVESFVLSSSVLFYFGHILVNCLCLSSASEMTYIGQVGR